MASSHARVYAGMDDGELLALAAESDELVEEARRALWSELERRGLGQQARTAYAERPHKLGLRPVPSLQLVTVAAFDDVLKANLAKAKLESEGIESILADEHIVRMNWFYSLFVGNIKLQVKEGDVDKAAEALEGVTTSAAKLPRASLKKLAWFFLVLMGLGAVINLIMFLAQRGQQ